MTMPPWLTWALVRRLLPYIALALALWGAWRWHENALAEAAKTAATAQKQADEAAYRRSADAAAAKQAKLVAANAAKRDAINERTTDALQKSRDDIARSYDDLRMRWAAHRAAESAAGRGGAAGVPGAAARTDAADCAAEGWVSFDVAAAAAQAADEAIAKDDRWIAWAKEQQAAWPKD